MWQRGDIFLLILNLSTRWRCTLTQESRYLSSRKFSGHRLNGEGISVLSEYFFYETLSHKIIYFSRLRGRNLKLITYLHLILRLKRVELNLHTVYLLRHKDLACGFTSRIHGLLSDAVHNS
jgi:hypothetical protein